MVAIVAGNGLGLERGSGNLLGSRGQLGSASLGRGNQLVSVNSATGNLVIQTQDEFLVGRGPDAAFASSYNSLGAANSSYTNLDGTADADGWLLNTQRKIVLTGTGNTAGSTATLTDWDGTQVVYTYNTTTARYEASEHPYKDDLLTWSANIFTHTDGASRAVQRFASDIGGRLIDVKDADGNTIAFTYDAATTAGRLSRVTMADSTGSQFNYVDYVYDTVNRKLTLTTSYYDLVSSTNKTLSRIVYGYDTANRLSTVTTDITPLNGADSVTYGVTYTYKDATSKLVTGIAQSDGTSFTILYDASNRVQTLTQAMAAGVSQATNFTYDTTNRVTTITDALSNVYKMTYDTAGRLTRLEEPAPVAGGNATIKTFVYDAAGAVIEVLAFDNPANVGNASLAITLERSRYDANGNLLERVFGDNSAVAYTYGTQNELLTETHYAGFDANGLADGVAPAGAMVGHYVYDDAANNGVNDDGTTYTGTNAADVAEKHLRFSISAEGRVTEYRYNTYGQLTAQIGYAATAYAGSTWTEAALAAWVAGADRTQTQRTDYLYDFRGNLSQATSWSKTDSAGTGVTTEDWSRTDYVYDQAGRLLTRRASGTNALGGEAAPVTETFAYDGLGRTISSTDLLGQTTTVTIVDGTRTTTIATPNAPTETVIENVGGTLASDAVSASGLATSTTSYAYDALGRLRKATDTAGVSTYYVYDRQGRLTATIDGDGSMTERKYDGADRVIATVTYANAVSAANLTALGTVTTNTEAATIRPAASAADRWNWTVYDKAGRVIETIDGTGAATITAYDGAGRATAIKSYVYAIAAATLNGADGISGLRTAPPAVQVLPTANATLDRMARNLYDNDGFQVGTLDPDGFLTEFVYDKAGRKVESIGYSGVTSAALRASGTFAQLKASITLSAASDIHNYWLYDGRGRLGAVIDGEGNVTRYHYSARGDLDQEIHGQKVTASTSYTLATLPAASGTLETTRYYRNAAGLITSRVRTLASGTETLSYTYDTRGRVLTETMAETVSAETRTQTHRYDTKGRLIGDLAGVGSAALAGLGASPTQAQIDTIYATYGTRYVYDAADRLIAKIAPDGSGATGAKTLYYYDGDGRLRFEVNTLGEVVEHRYNVLEDRTDSYLYATRIAAGTLATLTGGLVTTTITNAVTAIANATLDSRTQTVFDNRGMLAQGTDPLGRVTTFTYSAFGELLSSAAAVSASPALTGTHVQDFTPRGLKAWENEVQDASNASTMLRSVYTYDAFGRRIQSVQNGTDLRAQLWTYDRAGRTVTRRDALAATTTLAYDARSNLISSTDGNGKTTSYSYDLFSRTTTTISAEGITSSVKVNAYGQAILVTDGAGRTRSYTYDKDGNLKTATDAAGTTTYNYDYADRLVDMIDAKGVDTHYSYDAVGRVLTQVSDYGSGKLNLTTTTAYDAKGEAVSVTDPLGTVTTYQYDRAGQKTRVVQDAGAGKLNITTDFVYRADGKVISQTDAVGTAQQRVTAFEYDAYGRLTRRVEDSGAGKLNAATQFYYDVNGNMVATTDALGRTTRLVYDLDNRLVLTIDAEGQVIQNFYDGEGRVSATRKYTGTLSAAQLAALADPSLPAQWNEISNAGNGNLTITRKVKDWVIGVVTPTAVATIAAAATDRVTRSFFDGDGRMVYAVDAEGYVTQNVYDRAGNAIQTIRYTLQTSLTNASTTTNVAALFTTTLNGGALATGIPADAAVTTFVFDGANRMTDVTDAAGVVTHFVLDALGQVTDTHVAYGTADVAVTHTVFDNAGRVTSQTRAYGQPEAATTSYAYNALGQATGITDARGFTTTRSFDNLGRMLSETVPLDASTSATSSYQYDARGNRVKATDPRGNSGYVYYDNLDRATLQVDPEGFVVKIEYAIGAQVSKVTRYANAATNMASVSAATLPVWTADGARDAVSTVTYDKTDRVKTATDAEGFVESYAYDALGNRTSVTGKLGGVVNYAFDKRGLVTTETHVQGAYDAAGTLVLSQVQTTYAYDSRGNLTQKFEGANIPASGTNLTYGRLITTYAYDKLDRLITQTDPAFFGLTPVTTWQYDKRGNVILQTAANGGKTYSFYDHNNRKIAEISPVNTLSSWAYDANGNVTSQRIWAGTAGFPANPGGAAPVGGGASRETQLVYDRNNRLIQTTTVNVRTGAFNGSAFVTAAAQNLSSYNVYDAGGNLIKETDANGNSVYHYYDKRGREVAKVDQENYLTSWTRDADGNVTLEKRFTNRVAGTPPTGGAAPTVTVDAANDRATQFTYDRMGRRLTETRLGLIAYKLDAGGGLITDASAATVTYTYNGLGQVKSKTEATLDRTDYQYDLQGRLERQLEAVAPDVNTSGTATARLATYFYYDANNNIVRTVERAEAGTAAAGAPGTVGAYATGYSAANDRIVTYGYNGRKLQWTVDAIGGQRNYWYDVMGNRTHDYYQRANSAGVIDTANAVYEGTLSSYDLAGRVVSQWQAAYNSAGAWVTQGPVTQFTYNTAGDVTGRYIGGYLQEGFDYDNAGRVVKSTGGDGVQKFVVYDGNGNATLVLQSNGRDMTADTVDTALAYVGAIDTMTAADVVATISTYDKRNMSLATREPNRTIANTANTATTMTQTLVRSRTYNAFGDAASDTDARGNVTNYSYNVMGRLVLKQNPTVNVTSDTGVVSATRPTEAYAYDVSGRLIAVQDANGAWTRRSLLAGTGYGGTDALSRKEYRPDTSVWENRYDAFGNAVETYDGLLRKTVNVYDKGDRLIQVTRPSGLVEGFGYDVLGQRVKHWNNVFQSPIYGEPVWIESGYWDYGGYNPGPPYHQIQIIGDDPVWVDTSHWETPIIGYNPTLELTDYDAQGRIVKTVDFAGEVTTSTYSWSTAAAANNAGLGLTGGWVKNTSYANGHSASETTDVFGRMLARTDLGGNSYTMAYNRAGQQVSQLSSAGQNLTYTYYNTGRLAAMSDNANIYMGWSTSNIDSSYTYDADGNRTYERMAGTYTSYDWYGGGYYVYTIVHQEAKATWDAMNRFITYSDTGVNTGNGAVNISNEYDANGNVRRTLATHLSINNNQSFGAQVTEDYWYKYDSLNRMTLVKGSLVGGVIVRGAYSDAREIMYDNAGQRVSQARSILYYDPYYGYPIGTAEEREVYSYNADGLVTDVQIGTGAPVYTGNPTAPTSYTLRARNTYDLLGRVTDYKEYAADGVTVNFNRYAIGYDNHNAVLYEASTLRRYESDGYLYVTYASISNSYGAGGVLNSTTSTNYRYKNGTTYQDVPDTRSTYTYVWWDSAQQSGISYDSDLGSGSNPIFNTYYSYDTNGRLSSVSIQDGRPRTVSYVTDASGQILTRTEADNLSGGDPKQIWWYFDGKQVGTTGNNGNSDPDYATALNERIQTPPSSTNGAFRLGSTYGASYSDFDQAYNSLSPGEGTGAGSAYTVRSGDTLASIAQAVFGDASLWYMIAEANGLSGSSSLSPGQMLRIPGAVSNVHNSSTTFKPYDAASHIGDVSPNTPKPPKKAPCGGFGKILLAVIAIAVAVVVTAGAAAVMAHVTLGAALGAMFGGAAIAGATVGTWVVAGAIGGAVGSMVSQGIGVATGLQDKFSWKGVALAAVGGAVGGYFTGLGNAAKLAASVPASGAAGAAQGAANLANGATQAAKELGGFAKFITGTGFTNTVARAVVSNLATQGIGLLTGLQNKFSWSGLAASAVGSAVGFGVGKLTNVAPILGPQGDASIGNIAATVVTSAASLLASAAARSMIDGTDFGDNVIAALPDAIAQTIADLALRTITSGVAEMAPTPPAAGPIGTLSDTQARSEALKAAQATMATATAPIRQRIATDDGIINDPTKSAADIAAATIDKATANALLTVAEAPFRALATTTYNDAVTANAAAQTQLTSDQAALPGLTTVAAQKKAALAGLPAAATTAARDAAIADSVTAGSAIIVNATDQVVDVRRLIGNAQLALDAANYLGDTPKITAATALLNTATPMLAPQKIASLGIIQSVFANNYMPAMAQNNTIPGVRIYALKQYMTTLTNAMVRESPERAAALVGIGGLGTLGTVRLVGIDFSAQDPFFANDPGYSRYVLEGPRGYGDESTNGTNEGQTMAEIRTIDLKPDATQDQRSYDVVNHELNHMFDRWLAGYLGPAVLSANHLGTPVNNVLSQSSEFTTAYTNDLAYVSGPSPSGVAGRTRLDDLITAAGTDTIQLNFLGRFKPGQYYNQGTVTAGAAFTPTADNLIASKSEDFAEGWLMSSVPAYSALFSATGPFSNTGAYFRNLDTALHSMLPPPPPPPTPAPPPAGHHH